MAKKLNTYVTVGDTTYGPDDDDVPDEVFAQIDPDLVEESRQSRSSKSKSGEES